MRSGAGMLVPLQGAAAGCRLQGVAQGVAAGVAARCCRMLLQGAAVRVLCGLWSGVLLSECGAVMKLGCWCCCRGWLRDVCGSVGVRP